MSTRETMGTALVTGGSKGLGRAMALGLAQDGWDIWLNYRSDAAGAAAVAAEIEALGRDCRLLPFDVADQAAVQAALEPLLAETTPGAVISNAGFARDGLLALMDAQAWKSVLAVHLDGFFNVVRCVLPRMLRARKGRIVAIASTAGQTGSPGQTNYSAAKAGLLGAVRSLAAEVARRNVLVNAVAPGFIATDMTAHLPEPELAARIPLGRFGTPEEVAAAVRFLCSDKAAYITGQTLSVNGGIHM